MHHIAGRSYIYMNERRLSSVCLYQFQRPLQLHDAALTHRNLAALGSLGLGALRGSWRR